MNNAQTYTDKSNLSLPNRRERLRMLLKLRSQRQLFMVGSIALALIAALLAAALIQARNAPEVVRLGTGMASVDASASVSPGQGLSDSGSNEAAAADTGESYIGSGEASFYGEELRGNRTASGEIFDPERLTAAHRTLPLGSRVRVTNTRNQESVVVRINDRGPFHGNRVIDLSTAAARTIGLIQSGTGKVRLALLVD